MKSDLLETWKRCNSVNFLMLEAIPSKAFGDQYSTRTRTVASQFAHMHNIRLYHLDKRSDGLGTGLKSFPRGAQPTKKELQVALKASEKAMAGFFEACEENGKVKSWKGSPSTFLGYLIAHEAHHRGLVTVSLRMSGTKIPAEIVYGIWAAWNKT